MIDCMTGLESTAGLNPAAGPAGDHWGDPGPSEVWARTRSASREARQIRVESGEYALDLRLQPSRVTRGTAVAGQLARLAGEPIPDAPAYLVADGEIAATAFSGDLGDFFLDGTAGELLELWLFVGDERRIAVKLSD